MALSSPAAPLPGLKSRDDKSFSCSKEILFNPSFVSFGMFAPLFFQNGWFQVSCIVFLNFCESQKLVQKQSKLERWIKQNFFGAWK